MAVKMIHHHGFTVSDVQSSLKFYRDTLGFEELRVSERKELPSCISSRRCCGIR